MDIWKVPDVILVDYDPSKLERKRNNLIHAHSLIPPILQRINVCRDQKISSGNKKGDNMRWMK
jgi:hypothetical protein